jgi:pimeloyl-ACP methyl ester carboxylesterase
LALETAEKMLEALPNGRLIHVDKAAHMVFEDNPADFIEALHGFLD